MRAGSGGPKVGKDSPTGNLQAKAAAQFGRFFGRKIKNAGAEMNPASAFPVRKFQSAKNPGDK